MVIRAIFGCSSHSDRNKGISFHSISAVNSLQGKADFELRKKWRDGYLAAISSSISREGFGQNRSVQIQSLSFLASQLICTIKPIPTGCPIEVSGCCEGTRVPASQ